ncbi:MAG: 2-succinyl-5-enolpyruvyl-6-hydroxy-3-cyclohexene-1-carboxylic-acid synthase [Cyanobacteria bacterium P01_E01_bin.6]
MPHHSHVIDFRTTNTVWCSVLVETLHCLGLTTAIICPGSRSTPLTLAFVQHPAIDAIPILDERSASFFALGIARQTHQAVALVCTSGTAGANFYPAVIEAFESRVPLVVMTADRPPELRQCHSGQTIDQQKLYGAVPNWYAELALPSLDEAMLAYGRQTMIHAWERSHSPIPGPVHLNMPFRDPLAPLPEPEAFALAETFDGDRFFQHITPSHHHPTSSSSPLASIPSLPTSIWEQWQSIPDGIIIAGIAQPPHPERYCRAIAQLSATFGWPVLAEGLSPVRNNATLKAHLISTYDTILRQPDDASRLAPSCVIRIGEMPTSKILRQWIAECNPLQWVIDGGDRNLDPTHGRTIHVRCSIEQLVSLMPSQNLTPSLKALNLSPFLTQWMDAEQSTRHRLDDQMAAIKDWFEGKVAWTLSQTLPRNTPLFIANSTPVRDVEWFWKPGDRRIRPFFNRGANGIDGTLSTALGVAHRNQSSVLLTGDLAFLHDTNGLLVTKKFQGHLTIILMNNDGGGIFEFLPMAQFDPPFEEFFAMPQHIDFSALCATYGVSYELMQSWAMLEERLRCLPNDGVRVLEIQCDRRSSFQQRQQFWS